MKDLLLFARTGRRGGSRGHHGELERQGAKRSDEGCYKHEIERRFHFCLFRFKFDKVVMNGMDLCVCMLLFLFCFEKAFETG